MARYPRWFKREAYIGWVQIARALGLKPSVLRRWCKDARVSLPRIGTRVYLPKFQVPLLLERFWWARFKRFRSSDLKCLIKVAQQPDLAETVRVATVKRRHVLVEKGQGGEEEKTKDDPSPEGER